MLVNGKTGKILVADDDEGFRNIIGDILKEHTEYEYSFATHGGEVIEMVNNYKPDVILLDIVMPERNGYEVAKELKQSEKTKGIPIIFMTGLTGESSVVRAFHLGGIDYVTKPFKLNVLLVRIEAQMKLKKMQDELHEKNLFLKDRERHLESLVEKKTRQIHEITLAMVSALEDANFYNDDETGKHIKRVSEYSGKLAEMYGCEHSYVNKIKLYASLHDVGKVGVPYDILKKRGKLTDSEFTKIQKHVTIGFQMLNSPGIDEMAQNIILYHHEKWDGSGYPEHRKGNDIPLAARIVAMADVFDALINERVYKKAYSSEKTKRIMEAGRGTHFEPKLLDIFFDYLDDLYEIYRENQ